MDKSIIIFGSSRSNGNTYEAVNQVMKKLDGSYLINLADYEISDYDYENKNINDGFMCVVEKMLKYKTIILATPVYWYTMSASMKRFIDRITDLLTIDKDKGRLLRDKNLAVISSYGVELGIDGFEKIFINSAEYLGMKYLGCYFHYAGEDKSFIAKNPKLLRQFIELIQ